jgi:hypothetical protein
MEYDRMLAQLFSEEDSARSMAARLMEIGQRSAGAAAAERESLISFLRGPMERHFLYEEQVLFPLLEEHDLGPEVQVAKKHHDTLRENAAELEAASGDHIGEMIVDIARLLMHHTNFEGDYIYPELTHEEWRELMKATLLATQEAAPEGGERERGSPAAADDPRPAP